jgi:arginyl-tRNA synthetase
LRVRDEIEAALAEAARSLGVDGDLPDFEVGRARNPAHGDYASSVGMKLARELRKSPPQIAADVAAGIQVPSGAVTAEAAGGYVNFRLRPEWLQGLIGEVAATGAGYGRSDAGRGERVQVEFVSINPTGPLHVGNGRGAVLGDSIARLLEFTGHAIEREYYVNDFGTQAHKFGASIYARLHGEEPPEGGYVGEYVQELADLARRELSGIEALPREEAIDRLCDFGSWTVIERTKQTVERIGIRFDSFFSERSLWDERGLSRVALERLRNRGFLVEKEGAVWFAPALEEDEGAEETEERVVIRSDGLHTYFGSDLGYLLSRFEDRRFERVIEVWGADHHGYVQRFLAGAAALGVDTNRLELILHQFVTLKEGKMSKRSGRFVTLDDLVDEVGADAVRFFYLLRSQDAMIEFDLELALQQSSANPVYYAQYAHARLANVENVAAERHATLPPADPRLLDKPWELDVARQLAFWPETVEEAARRREPHRITYFVQDLADRVHKFYDRGNREGELRVVVDNAALTAARLELCRAARGTLGAALNLLGVSAPERM